MFVNIYLILGKTFTLESLHVLLLLLLLVKMQRFIFLKLNCGNESCCYVSISVETKPVKITR